MNRIIPDGCLQFWGGMGYTLENKVSRMYRDGRLGSIGGGADEVMLGILAKIMGIAKKPPGAEAAVPLMEHALNASAAAGRPAGDPEEDRNDIETLSYLVARFATKEIAPHVREWDEPASFRAACISARRNSGLLGLGYPEDLGGTPASQRMRNALTLALARHGASGGVFAGLFSHNIGLPPVLRHGIAEACSARSCRRCCAARRSPRWPSPSPVAARTWRRCAPRRGATATTTSSTAKRSSSPPACGPTSSPWRCAPAKRRLDELDDSRRNGAGARGISLIVVPGDSKGLSRTPLHKMGWHVLRHRAAALRRRARAGAVT